MTPSEISIAEGLSEAQRNAIGAFQGHGQYDRIFGELNALELLHIDVMKSADGTIIRWKCRPTSAGARIRSYLISKGS